MKQWLCETDKEVECFHPVCEKALNEALSMLNMSKDFSVEHHRYVGNLEMDLVISNNSTKKIFCVIEVKRTIPAIFSTRYQYQAMSYVQSLRDSEKLTNYYILTNLECSSLFLYSPQRQNVYDQLLNPGVVFNHKFKDVDETTFRRDLVLHYKGLLLNIINNNNDYVLSFSDFTKTVKESMSYLNQWNSSLAFMFYEYIRGSFSEINRKELFDIKVYRNDILKICKEASRVNFKGIFGFSEEEYDTTFRPIQKTLAELYKLGKNYKDADAICNIMHQVISEGYTHDGEVPTDIELAQTLVHLVKSFIDKIPDGCNITDPAAGSGTLLSASIDGFPEITPLQIQANDINPKLIQLLTLRMGLHFANTVSKTFSPTISTYDICELNKSYFENTAVIVLNPPYLSAVSNGCIEKKEKISSKIRLLTGQHSVTNIGQAPLECLFLELIVNLVKPNTIIACIIPNTHLSALGPSEIAFRKFLLEDFGLSMIFNYPQTKLFEEVLQNTSIFIGIAGKKQENVKFLQSLIYITELDKNTITSSLNNIKTNINPIELADGILGNIVPTSKLENMLTEGWMFLDAFVSEVDIFIQNKILSKPSRFSKVDENNYGEIKRGKVGNSGGSDLLYITSNTEIYNAVQECVEPYTKPGMRNSDYNEINVGNGDQKFLDISNMDDSDINTVVGVYLANITKNSKQKKISKGLDDWKSILKRESKNYVPKNTVLLPRATRRTASVYRTNEITYISTNFISIPLASKEEAIVLASWMSTIFYQLELERYSKNQSGMRKLEVENIKRTHAPIFGVLSEDEINKICKTPIEDFIDLRNPKVRNIDILWAEILNSNIENELFLDSTIRYLTILAKNREN